MSAIVNIYNTLLYYPLVNLLVIFYQILGQNLGLAIIAITILIKVVTYPLTKPSLQLAKKQKELQPEIQKLKAQYKNKQVFAQKQMELYKKHGINPAAGCLPQIVQLVILFALYRVFTTILGNSGVVGEELNSILYFERFALEVGETINTQFLYLDLTKPDPYFIIPVLAAASQFLLSKLMVANTSKMEKPVKQTPSKEDDFMMIMQKQSMYILPIFTLVIGISLPSGLVLFWFISTLIALIQYLMLNKKDFKKDVESLKKIGSDKLTNINKSKSGSEIVEGEIVDK